ncbi:MAG: hypothetical protein ACO3AY_07965 [Chitinophagaceae bacterium]
MIRWIKYGLILSITAKAFCNEVIEFKAATNTSINVADGNAIFIQYVGAKGDAGTFMKLKMTYLTNETYLPWHMLSGLYLNGPAIIENEKAETTNTYGIPYKILNSRTVLKDTNNSGNYTKAIYLDDTNNPDYTEYQNWLSLSNLPIPENIYTGTSLESSGFLVMYKKFTNQPFKSIIIKSNETKTINIPSGKRFVIPKTDIFGPTIGVTLFGSGGSVDGNFATTWGYSTGREIWPSSLSFAIKGTIKDGYDVNFSGIEIDGPETITLSALPILIVSAGGSALSASANNEYNGSRFGIFTYYFMDEYVAAMPSSDVNAIATTIVGTAGNYGLATKTDISDALNQSRTDGINSVLSNPNLWTLYTADQIQNMAMGGLILNKNVNGTFTLNYDIEQSTDLQTWTPYQALSLPLSGLPTNKAFVRIKLKNNQ